MRVFRNVVFVAIACTAGALALAQTTTPPPSGWLGAALSDAPPAAGEGAAPGGVVVKQIVEDSPAERAGLRGRDVVVAVDGVAVSAAAELIARIKRLPPDSWVSLEIRRRDASRTVDVRLGERPTEPGSSSFVRGWIGAFVMDLPPKLRVHFGAPEDAGVMVRDLEAGGSAEAAGLRLGDVIHAIDGEPVKGPADFHRLVADAGVENAIELSVGRDGAPLVLECVVAKAPKRTPQL